MRKYLYRSGAVIIAASTSLLTISLSPSVLAQKPDATASHLQKQTDKVTYNNGIEGIVIISPINPVEQPGVINFSPYQATITVLRPDGEILTQFQSGTDGRFRVELKPGIYILRPESEGIYPRAEEQTVRVSKNQFTKVLISYDSGIR